jgi:hypothetical protein
MKLFKEWMEQRDQNNIKQTILALLGLDDDGLGVPLESFEGILTKLKPLGIWQTMPAEKQAAITSMVEKGIGTVGELIDKMTEMGDSVEKTGVLEPQGDEERSSLDMKP